jgi:formyl-CoA transferase
VFSALTREELIARLNAADTAFAEVNDMGALSRHPHLRRTAVDTQAGRVSLPPPAALFDGAPRPCGSVPALGADTARVLNELPLNPSSEL